MINIGSRRECFFDDYLIDLDKTTAERRLHQPIIRDIVLKHDAPWEGDGCDFHNFFYDEEYGKYRLYLATNGIINVQSRRIKDSGIGKFFDGIFVSEKLGYNKPDKRFFDLAFAEIEGFSHDETVIVGDLLTSDIKGGLNAGIKTVYFNPTGAKNDTGIIPHYEISSLSELPKLLKEM